MTNMIILLVMISKIKKMSLDQEKQDQGPLDSQPQGPGIKNSWKPYLKILSAENSNYIVETKHVRHENI